MPTQYFREVDAFYTVYFAVFSRGGYQAYYALRSIFEGRIPFILCTTQYFSRVKYYSSMHNAVLTGSGDYLYYALRSIFGQWILIILCLRSIFGEWFMFILCTTQYFRGRICTTQCFRRVDSIYTMYYAVFSRGGYYSYYALRKIFEEWILFILCTTQYFKVVDTICTMHYAVFSGSGQNLYYTYAVLSASRYYLYYKLHSIFGGGIRTTRYFGEWVLYILCPTQYYRGADTNHTMHYEGFSGS